MTVHAPFRFAPIHRWVHFPEWGPLVSHDVPFKDGLSGEIELEIEATTPLLVGGARRKAKKKEELPEAEQAAWPNGKEAEVWPFQLPNGRWAIPPSALQGMIRSILEIACFGRLGPWIAGPRFGIRDLSPAAIPFYRKRLMNQVRPGFLHSNDAGWWITPCEEETRRILFDDIPCNSHSSPDWQTETGAEKRYSWISSVGPWRPTGEIRATKLRADPHGSAWLVITGNTGTKRREFVFVEAAGAIPIKLEQPVVDDFRFVHEGQGSADPDDWNTTWRFFFEKGYPVDQNRTFEEGGRVPVFFIGSHDRVDAFGLASMFKLAHRGSIHDLLSNSHREHHGEPRYDLPTLIFGAVADAKSGTGLKRRASLDLAICSENGHQLVSYERAVLLSPKPSYFPIYVRQAGVEKRDDRLPAYEFRDKKGKIKRASEPYATYTPLDGSLFNVKNKDGCIVRRREHEQPELAGIKVWPARGSVSDRVRPPYLDVEKSRKISTTLRALPSGTKLTCKVRFHNLRPVELGALLWALSFGKAATWTAGKNIAKDIPLRHRLGMGKPFGLGEVAIAVRRMSARDVTDGTVDDPEPLIKKFTDHMDAAYAVQAGEDGQWRESVQVQTLLAAANPDNGTRENTEVRTGTWGQENWKIRRLDYMELNPEQGGWNDFVDAKSDQQGNAHFLKRYAKGHELSRPVLSKHTPSPLRQGGVRGRGAPTRSRNKSAGGNAPAANLLFRKGETVNWNGELVVVQRDVRPDEKMATVKDEYGDIGHAPVRQLRPRR